MITTIESIPAPRFGGALWRVARRTTRLALPFAGTRWNPLFAVVLHRGRRTGVEYLTPVAARRVPGGFVVSLAFGAQADWHRNLQVAGGGRIRWRAIDYRVDAPSRIDATTALRAFNPMQRFALRAARISGFVLLPDEGPAVP